jgi:hypothetical protein
LPHLGPKEERATEATLERNLIIGYVKQLFHRPDFPTEIYVALDDSAMAFKGDVVWPNSDCEHPFDFVPISRIDALLLNLPTKEEFLQILGVEKIEHVTPEAAAKFWKEFKFEFAETAVNVKLTWE